MRRFLVTEIPRKGQPVPLPKDEAQHAKSVLRLRDGALVEVLDGSGIAVEANLRSDGNRIWAEYHNELQAPSPLETVPVVLNISILKNDAMTWVIEKAVELGAQELRPIIAENSVVQIGKKKPEEFRVRWQKIADQALKQCGRRKSLVVHPPSDFYRSLQKNAFYCDAHAGKKAKDISDLLLDFKTPATLFIGPEGGWSPQEKEELSTRYPAVSLGPLILRAETASVMALSLAANFYRARSKT